jgi:hypothetical protein
VEKPHPLNANLPAVGFNKALYMFCAVALNLVIKKCSVTWLGRAMRYLNKAAASFLPMGTALSLLPLPVTSM